MRQETFERVSRAGAVLVSAWLCLVGVSTAAPVGERVLSDAEDQLVRQARVIYLDARSSTWRSRGRVSFPLVPSLRMKLESAGLTVVQNQADPHDLTLKVDYKEEKGQQFRVDLYGTDITCVVSLEHPELGALFHLAVQESSIYPESGSRPYLHAVENFETNPYFYFLGEFVRARIVSRVDTTGALIDALDRLPDQVPLINAHTLHPSETLYVTWVRENTVRELGRLRDPRALPVLMKLLGHANPRVRLLSVEALGELRSVGSRSAIEHVA
jgi:hypothetical protein